MAMDAMEATNTISTYDAANIGEAMGAKGAMDAMYHCFVSTAYLSRLSSSASWKRLLAMPVLGNDHTVLLGSDGRAVACKSERRTYEEH